MAEKPFMVAAKSREQKGGVTATTATDSKSVSLSCMQAICPGLAVALTSTIPVDHELIMNSRSLSPHCMRFWGNNWTPTITHIYGAYRLY